MFLEKMQILFHDHAVRNVYNCMYLCIRRFIFDKHKTADIENVVFIRSLYFLYVFSVYIICNACITNRIICRVHSLKNKLNNLNCFFKTFLLHP